MNRPQMKPTRTGDIGSPDTNPPVKPSPKTVEELMRPRYIVENLWPDSPYQVGEILVPDFEDRDKWVVEGYGLISPVLNDNPNKYPCLFRKLEWWEEREQEDMPAYVRYIENGVVVAVDHFDLETSSRWFMFLKGGYLPYSPREKWVPATEQEYNDFIKSKEHQTKHNG